MDKVAKRTFIRRKKGKELSLGAYQEIEINTSIEVIAGCLEREYYLTLTWPKPTIDLGRKYSPMKVVVVGHEVEALNYLQDFFTKYAEENKKSGALGPDEIVDMLLKLGFINLKKVK